MDAEDLARAAHTAALIALITTALGVAINNAPLMIWGGFAAITLFILGCIAMLYA